MAKVFAIQYVPDETPKEHASGAALYSKSGLKNKIHGDIWSSKCQWRIVEYELVPVATYTQKEFYEKYPAKK